MSGRMGPPVRPILFVDNQDSFVWNLVDYVSQFYPETVVKSNRVTLAEVESHAASGNRHLPGARPSGPPQGHRQLPGDHMSLAGYTDPGRLPGPPGHEPGLRRHHFPYQAAARQDLGDHSRREGHLPGPGEPLAGREAITPWPSKGCPRIWRSRPRPRTGS